MNQTPRRLSPIFTDTKIHARSIIRKHKRIQAFGWYGGKFSHLNWLLPLLPEHTHYIEPFCGSAAVLLNKPISTLETVNDLDGDITNFFRVLRDEPDELVRVLSLTPFSREELAIALQSTENPLERARRFYVRARQTRSGLGQSSSLGRWANSKANPRSGMHGVISRWLGGIEQLMEIANRLKRVQIENRPANEVIVRYQAQDALFFCDPPYVHDSRAGRAYRYEMSDSDHADFVDVCLSSLGKFIVCGYESATTDRLFKTKFWDKILAPVKTSHICKANRQEVVWVKR